MLYDFKRFRNAFTLAELMIAVGVLAVLASLTLPLIFGKMPDKNEAKLKKITYQIETVVSNLYDDDTAYPKKSDIYKVGFQNIQEVTVNGQTYGAEGTTEADVLKKKSKFSNLFYSQFNISGVNKPEFSEAPACTASDKTCKPPATKSFTTLDGVDWYLPLSDFSNGYAVMMVDINGSDTPNCYRDEATPNACLKPDRYIFYVGRNGTVSTKKPNPSEKTTHKLEITEYHHAATATAGGKINETGIKIKNGKDSYSSTSGITKTCTNFEVVEAGKLYKRVCTISPLEEKTKYLIPVTPESSYTTSWPNNRKIIMISNTDATYEVTYTPAVTRCINLKVENCNETIDKITNCLPTPQLYTDCMYKAQSDGPYKRKKYDESKDDSLYYYEYVGTGGDYKYECSSAATSLSNKGRYVTKANNKSEKDNGAIGNYLSVCGRLVSDYQLKFTPNTTKGYYLNTYSPLLSGSNDYAQNIHSGTEDLDFVVKLRKLTPDDEHLIYCKNHPSDTSCKCEENPSLGECITDPADPAYCASDAYKNEPRCKCKNSSGLTSSYCQTFCSANMSDSLCAGFCDMNPTYGACACQSNPNSSGCITFCSSSTNVTSSTCIDFCVNNPSNYYCSNFCSNSSHLSDPRCVTHCMYSKSYICDSYCRAGRQQTPPCDTYCKTYPHRCN